MEYLCFHKVSSPKPSKTFGIPVFSQGFLTKTFKHIWNTCVFTVFHAWRVALGGRGVGAGARWGSRYGSTRKESEDGEEAEDEEEEQE